MSSARFRAVVGACFVALVVSTGSSAPARADAPAVLFDESGDLLAQARQLYIEGLNARRAHQWDRARIMFLGAWRAQHHWQIAANLANAEIMLGRYRDAAEHAAIFMHDTRDLQDIDPRQRAEVERILASARAKVGVVTVTAPPGAEVLVNGSSVGRAPLESELFVEPGRTVLEARLDGYEPSMEPRDLVPGEEARVEMRLAAKPSEARPATQVTRPAWEERRRSLVPVVVLGAGAAVLLGGGVAFTVASNGKALGADVRLARLQVTAGPAPCWSATGAVAQGCVTLSSLNRSSDTFHDLAVAGFAGAGVAGLGALTYALWPTKKAEERTRLRLVPILGAGTGGLAASGAF